MGGCYSTEYYFGFVNISVSHLDVLSFALVVAFAFGMQALYSYCKNSKRATKHILGRASAQKGGQGPGQLPAAATYLPYPMPPTYPPPPGEMQATAPHAAPTTALVPWKYSGNLAA